MPRATQKYYIYVPYKDKEEAKVLGARWESESKRWFVPSGLDLEKFSKWHYPQKSEIDINKAINQFSQTLSEYGLLVDEPIMDGKIKRVKVEGDKGSQKSGAYIGYIDSYPAGYIENFKTGERINWKFKREKEYQSKPLVNNESFKKAQELKTAQREREQLELNEKTAVYLKREYESAKTLQGSHTYLRAKGIESIKTNDLKIDRFGNLLIPLSDIEGKMWSVQRISANGNKIIGVIKTKEQKERGEEYLARKKGCFYSSVPLDLHEQFFICEGFATAKSVEILLNKPSIMAVDSGNLIHVCEALLEKYPNKQITICADNDFTKDVNTGLNAALKCKEKFPQITIIKPSIAEKNITDFNDLMRVRGIQIARADITSQLALKSITDETKQIKSKGYER